MRDWNGHGACGVETPIWTFVIPAAGASETKYGRWRFVSQVPSAATGDTEISVYDDQRGRIIRFSYNSIKGIDQIIIGGGALGRPERFVLTRGVGLLHDCIAKTLPHLPAHES
jgi:hypothetical protein